MNELMVKCKDNIVYVKSIVAIYHILLVAILEICKKNNQLLKV